jgi:large subunit ribosomal protein L1
MTKHSKRYLAASARVERGRLYEPLEALALLKGLPAAKFDETVELAVNLGIDPRKSDQLVRGAVSLPKGLGKKVRVIVFAEGEKAEAARAAGADEVGSAELADRVAGGWTDFDICVASPDMMKHVGKLGKVLGPQGKMPSPKSGTVTPDVGKAVQEFKAGKVEFRTDATGIVHAVVGKMSFDAGKLAENIQAFINHVLNMKPASVKGHYVKSITVSATMSPGVPIAA